MTNWMTYNWLMADWQLTDGWLTAGWLLTADWLLADCWLTADWFLTDCLKIWARKMKIDCSRQTWTGRTNGRTNISISWAHVGAKNLSYSNHLSVLLYSKETEGNGLLFVREYFQESINFVINCLDYDHKTKQMLFDEKTFVTILYYLSVKDKIISLSSFEKKRYI